MQPLRGFCIASTISPSFLRRKGATIISLSLHQWNEQHPLFHNLENLGALFYIFGLWCKVFVCFSFWFYLSRFDPFLFTLHVRGITGVQIIYLMMYLSNTQSVLIVWFTRCLVPEVRVHTFKSTELRFLILAPICSFCLHILLKNLA